MGESACKCVYLACKFKVSLKAKLCGGETLCRSNIHTNVHIQLDRVLAALFSFLTHLDS